MLVALDLFSQYGYSDVSIERIATNVGIKAPSIYKHYSSKREILISIMQRGTDLFLEKIRKCSPFENSDYEENEKELDFGVGLSKLGVYIFQLFLRDEYIAKVRKIISVEIYKNEDMMRLYIRQYIEVPLQKHRELITNLPIKEEDIGILSFAFYSPIYMALKICDSNPEREGEMLALLNNTYAHFSKLVQ